MLTFVVPRATAPSGGHRYNSSVVAHWPVPAPRVVVLDGPWPRGDPASHARLAAALRQSEVALVDGLVGAAAPEVLADAAGAGCRIVLLVHLPLADEGGLEAADRAHLAALERRSVRSSWRVVATSRTAADDLRRRHGGTGIVAVPPGVDTAPLAEAHEPAGLLQVGAFGARKNQLGTLGALARCRDLAWTATLAGPVADEAYAWQVRRQAAGLGVSVIGALDDAALADAYARTDLLLHPAVAETWGMVVTEALARGVPAIVGAGTGAVEALGSGSAPDGLPGAVVDSGDPVELARVLRQWLTDPGIRVQWRHRAQAARTGLRGWPAAAAELARVVSAA